MTTATTDRQLVTIVGVALGALLILPTLFMGVGMMGFGPMMGGMWGMGATGGTVPSWMLVVGIAMQLLFLTVLVGGAYLVYRAVSGSDRPDRATEELRLAYARGDLTDEEYEQRREALERDA